MPIYNFGADFSIQQPEHTRHIPHGLPQLPAVRQLSHAEGGRNPFDGTDFLAYPYDLEEFLVPGFRSLDEAMKHYWSGIRVPTKDSYRFMRVKVAGGDKSLLIWADDLKEGRARLPLAAISRQSHEYNPEKFSPPYHAMKARYLGRRGNLAARIFRPVPFLAQYQMTIWAERKRDAEYILYQTITRFNPIAEFRMFDGKIAGRVQIKFGGANDASDKEAGYDQHANVRYEISMTAEAWLPLPEQVVPTVLGQVTHLKETVGTILGASLGSASSYPAARWVEPIDQVDDAESSLAGTS